MINDIQVGNRILAGIADINAGTNAVQENITSEKGFYDFMKTRRGLALVFWAMNGDHQANPFYVTEAEWRRNKPARSVINGRFLDCHTHYLASGGTHRADQYRQGARGCWWFFPEAYDFPNGPIAPPPTDPRPDQDKIPLHGRDQYEAHMKKFFELSDKRLRFFITPAPYNGPLNGRDDTASYDHMVETCRNINSAVRMRSAICHPTGAIEARQNGAELRPVLPSSNAAHLWKIYPRTNWIPGEGGGKEWLTLYLPQALDRLSNIDTVLIHWWDGDAEPTANDLGQVVSKYSKIRFVIFHACYPHLQQLSNLISAHTNLFAEIGGVFANQILGAHGRDGVGEAPAGTITGPAAAISMIRILRGELTNDDGVHANDKKILWGTDAIWHGSPVWQVEAFCRLNLTSNQQQDAAFKRRVLQMNPQSAFHII